MRSSHNFSNRLWFSLLPPLNVILLFCLCFEMLCFWCCKAAKQVKKKTTKETYLGHSSGGQFQHRNIYMCSRKTLYSFATLLEIIT